MSRIIEWLFGKSQTFEEYYLSKSTDLADLECRQKALAYRTVKPTYWL